MSRLALWNIAFGFMVLTIAACVGAILAFDTTQIFLQDRTQLLSWKMILQKSSHGHANLFGMLHIVFGLTLPYSRLSVKWKVGQTVGLCLGTIAIGPILMLRSFMQPSQEIDSWTMLSSVFLALALCALASHCLALFLRTSEK